MKGEVPPEDLVNDLDTFLDKNGHSDEAYQYALGILEMLGHTCIWESQQKPDLN